MSGQRVVAYLRVSTREQAEVGYGLDAQRDQILLQAQARGWQVVAWCEDAGVSGKSLDGRNGLSEAIALCESGQADALMATKIDRVSRSVVDFGQLIERAKRKGWSLVVLDIGLDLTSPTGKLVAHVISAVAEFERDMIGVRTSEGLAAARAKGVRIGSPPSIEGDVVERIEALRGEGMTYRKIAEALTAEGVPTPRGGRQWWASTVRGALGRTQRPIEAVA